ncbi:MAG: cysteine peptidase family C39 domain-containing protein [Sulfurimonas sp.]|jgi:hypothetical protein
MAQILIILLLTVFSLEATVFKVKSLKELKYDDVVAQTYEESCGASSLATLMNRYGENISEKDLLNDFNTTDMVNFLDIQNIAIKKGFRAKGYKITKDIFEQLNIPVIARVLRHKEYPHFIVVQNLKGDFVLSLDPSNGKSVISKNEFYSVWNQEDNGYILVVIPEENKVLKKIELLNNSNLLIK